MKLSFKICAVLFIINMFNMCSSLWFIILKWIGLFEIKSFFLEDMFVLSIFLIVPLAWILIELLTSDSKQKSNGNTI